MTSASLGNMHGQQHTLEQLETADGTTILQAMPSHHIEQLVTTGNQVSFLENHSSSAAQMTHAGATTAVFPQPTFIFPPAAAGQMSFIPRSTHHTGHTVTNLQPVVSQQFMTASPSQGTTTIQMPIQMEMAPQQQQLQQHPQQRQQQHAQLLQINTAPQQQT